MLNKYFFRKKKTTDAFDFNITHAAKWHTSECHSPEGAEY